MPEIEPPNEEADPIDIEATLRDYIRDELSGTYTVSMAIVKEVDTAARTCEVSLKYENKVLINEVPIASPYVGDDYGAVFPVSSGDEAFVLHNRRPISVGMAERGPIEQDSDRRYTLEDAVLFPLVWNGDLTIPTHDPGELLIAHESGSIIRMKPDGTTAIEHENGNVIRMAGSDGSITLGDPSSVKDIPQQPHTHNIPFTTTTITEEGGSTTDVVTSVGSGGQTGTSAEPNEEPLSDVSGS